MKIEKDNTKSIRVQDFIGRYKQIVRSLMAQLVQPIELVQLSYNYHTRPTGLIHLPPPTTFFSKAEYFCMARKTCFPLTTLYDFLTLPCSGVSTISAFVDRNVHVYL